MSDEKPKTRIHFNPRNTTTPPRGTTTTPTAQKVSRVKKNLTGKPRPKPTT